MGTVALEESGAPVLVREAQAVLREREERFRTLVPSASQKTDAVGRLAGGIARDFNNRWA